MNNNFIENQKIIADDLIGSAIHDPAAAAYIGQKIVPDDFHYTAHRQMMQNIKDIVTAGEQINFHEVAKGVDDGVAILNEICTRHLSSANHEAYVKASLEMGAKKRLQALCHETQEAISGELVELPKILSDLETKLATVKTPISSENAPMHIKSVAAEWIPEFWERMESGEKMKGVSTGYSELDKLTSGLQGSRLYVIGGRPGSGKSALALNLGLNVALGGKNVLFVSLEMNKTEIMDRAVANLSDVYLSNIENGFSDLKNQNEKHSQLKKIKNTISKLSLANFIVWDNTDIDVGDLVLESQRLNRLHPLDLIVVDYLGLMCTTDNEVNELGLISRNLKNLASKIDTPVIALHQVNRSVETRENKRPKMSDLRGSGKIEENANVVMFTYRDDYYEENPIRHDGKMEVIIQKNRSGKKGRAILNADLSKMQIKDLITPFDNPKIGAQS